MDVLLMFANDSVSGVFTILPAFCFSLLFLKTNC